MKNEIRDEKRSITFSLHSLLLFFYFSLFSKKDVNCWRGVDGVAKRRRLTTCTQRASLVQLHCVTLCSGRINSEKKSAGFRVVQRIVYAEIRGIEMNQSNHSATAAQIVSLRYVSGLKRFSSSSQPKPHHTFRHSPPPFFFFLFPTRCFVSLGKLVFFHLLFNEF